MKKEYDIFVGTVTETIYWNGMAYENNGKGIHWLTMDLSTGHLTSKSITTGELNPSFVMRSKSGEYLYVLNELQEYQNEATGCISAFRLHRESGTLELINRQKTRGTDPCYMTFDKEGKYIYVTNFTSGSVVSFPVNKDGGLGELQQFLKHQGSSVNRLRQLGAHPHSIILDTEGSYAVVPDLGNDLLMLYRPDSAKGVLTPAIIQAEPVTPGSGPRHGVFHPNGQFFYVTLELTSSVGAYRFEKESGRLTAIQNVPSSIVDGTGINTSADIKIRPDGRFLYVSNRGHGNIVTYRVNQEDGSLTFIALENSGGEKPRGIEITPDGRFLLAANQDTGKLVVFRIDEEKGTLSYVEEAEAPSASCVKIY